MTCETCVPWHASSEKQLAIRLDNMRAMPGPSIHRCPDCGSTDWATSREFIKEEKLPWFRRWFSR